MRQEKVKSISELAQLTNSLRQQGKTIVLAHGVFDLVHMGHVRHFKAARQEGDVLIVTITADKFVNKGPGRPIFNDVIRSEMLAAIECVDYVGISHNPSSEIILDSLRPNVYVKGSDYENPEDDITGKIKVEKDTVERHGGRLVFTKDITFSSSTLINSFLDVYDRPLQDYLNSHRDNDTITEILSLIEQIRDYRVLLVGDSIIDEYLYVEPMGKAAKENIIATKFCNREVFAGGVFAAANHVASFCKEVEIVTAIGEDDSYEDFIRSQLKPNVKLTVLRRPDKPTTRKTRYIDTSYTRKLFEVYSFDDAPLEDNLEEQFQDIIDERAPKCDVTIATDFGHGLISRNSIVLLGQKAKFLAVNTQTNSANHGFNLISRYPKADFVCIDEPEARMAVRDRFSSIESVISEGLPNLLNCEKFIVTHGRYGCVTFEGAGAISNIPAFTKTVVDTVGAGDAFLAVTAPLAAAGGRIDIVGFVGNAAGALKVGIVGHRQSIEKVSLVKFVTTLLK